VAWRSRPKLERQFARTTRVAKESPLDDVSPISCASALRYVASASAGLSMDSNTWATAVRLRPTSVLMSESPGVSAISASRAARACRCASRASAGAPTFAVSSATS